MGFQWISRTNSVECLYSGPLGILWNGVAPMRSENDNGQHYGEEEATDRANPGPGWREETNGPAQEQPPGAAPGMALCDAEGDFPGNAKGDDGTSAGSAGGEVRADGEEDSAGWFVYLIRRGDHCKIGVSKAPAERAKSLPGGSTVIHQFPSRIARTIERQLHGWFDDVRVRGEWFALEPSHVATVMSISACHSLADLPEPLKTYSVNLAPIRRCGMSIARGGKPLQIYLPEETIRRVRELADMNRRTITAEVELAIERHLQSPMLMADSPPLPEVQPPVRKPVGRPPKSPQPDHPAPQLKRKPGRPKKGGA